MLDESGLPADLAMAGKIVGKEEELRRARPKPPGLKLRSRLSSPWLALDLPLSFKGTERTVFATASLPAASDMSEVDTALGAAAPEAQLFRVSERQEPQLRVASYAMRTSTTPRWRPCRPYGFNLMSPGEFSGTAREETAKAELKLRGLAEQQPER